MRRRRLAAYDSTVSFSLPPPNVTVVRRADQAAFKSLLLEPAPPRVPIRWPCRHERPRLRERPARADRDGPHELHCHLDGSVRPDTLADLARQAGVPLARPIRELAVAPPDVGSLAAFLPYLDFPLDVLQSPPALQRAARELVEDWHRDGVAYGEARFAPQLHTRAAWASTMRSARSPPACVTAAAPPAWRPG